MIEKLIRVATSLRSCETLETSVNRKFSLIQSSECILPINQGQNVSKSTQLYTARPMKSSASRKLRKILEIRCNKLKMQKQKQKKVHHGFDGIFYTLAVWHIPMQIAVTWCEWHAITDACQRVGLGIKSSVIWWLCWQLHQLGFDAVGQWVIKLPFSPSRRFAWNCRCVCWQRYSDFIVPLISLASLRYNLTYDTFFLFCLF